MNRRQLRAAAIVVLAASTALAACSGEAPTADIPAATTLTPATSTPPVATTTSTTSTTSTTTIATTTIAATTTTTTTEAPIPIPEGVLVAVPLQNREDPAKDQFQVEMINGTDQRYDVRGVQFVWAGYTTVMTERDSIVVGGQVIDFPVPFPGATCVGDGTRATMPSVDDAVVVLVLESGESIEVPVVDKWHLARKLYEDDCLKQSIESMFTIEWTDLHEEEYEGRPVTAGELRVTRRNGVGEFKVLAVSNTIPFEFDAVETEPDETVLTLDADADVASVPIRFIESRCDPHALAEIKQPTKFIAQIQLADGTGHAYIVYPERDMWTPMRLTADKACVALGKVEFVGDG